MKKNFIKKYSFFTFTTVFLHLFFTIHNLHAVKEPAEITSNQKPDIPCIDRNQNKQNELCNKVRKDLDTQTQKERQKRGLRKKPPRSSRLQEGLKNLEPIITEFKSKDDAIVQQLSCDLRTIVKNASKTGNYEALSSFILNFTLRKNFRSKKKNRIIKNTN